MRNCAIRVAVGLGVVVCIGGVLNCFALVSALANNAIMVGGLLLLIGGAQQSKGISRLLICSRGRLMWLRPAVAVSLFIVLASVGFSIATQLPPKTLNFHDDLQKYLAHPVRLLATGTLRASPLSALGSETLGGMAYLHSLIAAHWPIAYVNGVDAIFGLGLLLAVVASAASGRSNSVGIIVTCLSMVLLIEPQYVNVSALYLSAALMAATVLMSANQLLVEKIAPSPPMLGILYAVLISLKTTGIIFVFFHLVVLSLAVWSLASSLRVALAWFGRTFFWVSVTVLPWVWIHLPNYLNSKIDRSIVVPSGPSEVLDLFSYETLFYGGTAVSYTSVAVFPAVVSLALLVRGWQRRMPSNIYSDGLAARIFVIGVSWSGLMIFLGFIFSSPLLAGFNAGLRYSVPFLLGITPVIVALVALQLWTGGAFILARTILAVALIITATFLPSRIGRWDQAIRHGSILAFPKLATSPSYISHIESALSEERRAFLLSLQEKVPASLPLLAWIDQPYFLNFKRNSIYDAEPAGLARSWAQLPAGVEYVIWEVSGFGVRTVRRYEAGMRGVGANERRSNASALRFVRELDQRVRSGEVLFFDGRYVVARLGQLPD